MMNHIFFFIPFLVVAGFGIYQDVSAVEVITGYDYFDVTNPDGTHTWSTHPPYVLDGNNYVPFIQNGNQITTHLGSVTLNPDGTFSWDDKFTDRIIAKYADVTNQNSWTYPNTLNNDTPDVSWNGNELISSKLKSGVGLLEYKYILINGEWKTQLEATNLSGLITKVFGFDQIIDLNSDTISFNGVTRNLDQFNNTTFDKTFLNNNKGKIINLLNGVNFDFDLGFENLYSITVYDTGINSSRLVFDYRTSTPLLPNETLIIDPTFTSSVPSSEGRAYSGGAAGAGCPAFSTGDGDLQVIKKDTASASSDCQGTFLNFDVTSLPSTITVTAASLQYDVIVSSNPINCSFVHLGFTGASDATTYDALISGTGSVTTIKSNSATCAGGVANNYSDSFDTGGYPALFKADITGDNIISLGIRYADWVRDASVHQQQFRAADAILTIVYTTTPPPWAVTDLVSTSTGSTTVDLDWTQPYLGGGNQALIGYQINKTTPWGVPTVLVNDTGTSTSAYTAAGLTIGTNYSFRVSAWTNNTGGHPFNNATGNILNVTTAMPQISCCAPVLTADSGSTTQIDLQWIASTLNNLRGYKIERQTPSGSSWATLVSNTTNTNIYYNNTGLTSNIIYNYRVYGLNSTGQSTVSNSYEMTTFHLPNAVTTLTGTATDLSTINLSWSAPTSYAPVIQGYMINGTTPTGLPVDILNPNTGTTATTATALNLLIGQEYSFRVSPITVHGKNASGNIWNGSTIQTFVIGNLSNPDITNTDDFSIFFNRTDINSTAIQLDVTYPNSYNLSCDFDYKYARINQTYSGLTTVPSGTDDKVATFTLINATGDLIQVRCWDTLTGDESKYVITITDFPFLQQIQSLRNGDYGTFFQIGAFDGVMLIIIFLGMVGLNRTTPIVGIIFVVITTLAMSFFGLITYPIIMYPALIMMIVWAFVTTRKDD